MANEDLNENPLNSNYSNNFLDLWTKLYPLKQKEDINSINNPLANLESGKGSIIGNISNILKNPYISSAIGGITDTLGNFIGDKSEYNGPKGGTTQTLDSVYGAASNIAMQINPMVGMAMKLNGLTAKGLNKLGMGTDAMTTTDAILGSNFLALSPIGMINGFGGTRSNSFTKDDSIFEKAGGSYNATSVLADKAGELANKKFGLLSRGALGNANDTIAEARRQMLAVGNIVDEAQNQFALQGSMSAINTNRRASQLNGGMDLRYAFSAKLGMKLEELNSTRKFLKEISSRKSRSIEQLIQYAKDKNPRFVQRMSEPVKSITLPNGQSGTHRLSYAEVDGRTIVYPEIYEDQNGELIFDPNNAVRHAIDNGDFLEMTTDEAELFTNDNYKQGWPEFFNSSNEVEQFQKGGVLTEELTFAILKEEFVPSVLIEEEVESVEQFQKGGSFNVIPEGALHARKHHMDMEGITKKGIPVISESEGGEIQQQAEIEREELILRLEVTKQIEELSKQNTDEAAIEAGKLLVSEILYNTIDNTKTLI